jgi:hypothetical protein
MDIIYLFSGILISTIFLKQEWCVEIYIDIIVRGNLKFELSVHKKRGCRVIFTAKDEDDRTILRAPIMHNGAIKIYSNIQEAIADATTRLAAMS